MGYDPADIIAKTFKQDGTQVGSTDKFFDYIKSNAATFGTWGKYDTYAGPIASILFIGVSKDSAGNSYPQIYDLNIPTFAANHGESSTGANCGTTGNDGLYSKERYLPMPTNHNKNTRLTSITSPASSLSTMNKALTAASAASGSMDNVIKDCDKYWTTLDQACVGYTGTRATELQQGSHPLAYLFYTVSLVEELQARYGYRQFDPSRPYSLKNWAYPGGDITRFFKILYLPQLDFYLHAGIVNNPTLITKELVQTSMFDDMFQTMMHFSKNAAITDTNTSKALFAANIHSTALKTGDFLICGQYIYSKDFRYKLHLRQNGQLNVYKFPIADIQMATPFNSVFTPSWSISATDKFPCIFVFNNRKLSVVGNPGYTLSVCSGVISSDKAGTNSGIIASWDAAGYTSSDYTLLVAPGGIPVVASPGMNDTTPYVTIQPGSNANSLNVVDITDALDVRCVNGWNYGTLATNVTTLPSPSDPTKMSCYSSPFVKASGLGGTGLAGSKMEFTDTALQIIHWVQKALPANVADTSYDLVYSGFLSTIQKLGYLNFSAVADVQKDYCIHGNRYPNIPMCINHIVGATGKWREIISHMRTIASMDKAALPSYYKNICASTLNPSTALMNACVASGNPTSNISPIVASIVALDIKFIFLINPIPNDQMDAAALALAGRTGYTTEQLDYLLPIMHKSQFPKWKELYKAATELAAFPDMDFSQFTYSWLYQQWMVPSMPATVVYIKTNTGLLRYSGNMNFPYDSTTKTSYSYDDPFWKRILLSATSVLPIGNLSGAQATVMDASFQLIDSDTYTTVTQLGPYDNISITITGLSAPANAIVYMKTINYDKLITYSRTLYQRFEDSSMTLDASPFGTAPDIFYPRIKTYIQSKPFDNISNQWCDLATTNKYSDTDLKYFSKSNADELKNICNTAYGATVTDMNKKCALPENRYKSGFSNRCVSQSSMRQQFSNLKERYSGDIKCPDICATAIAGTDLFNACKTGSVGYCKLGSNILNNACTKDMELYPEVKALRSDWCDAHINDSRYPIYCPEIIPATSIVTTNAPAAPVPTVQSLVGSTVIDPNVPLVAEMDTTTPENNSGISTTATTPENNPDTSTAAQNSGMSIETILIIVGIVIAIFIAGLVAGRFFYKKWKMKKLVSAPLITPIVVPTLAAAIATKPILKTTAPKPILKPTRTRNVK